MGAERAYVDLENVAWMFGVAVFFDLLMAISHPKPYEYALMVVVPLFCLRGALSGLYFRGETLTIVNPLCTVRVRWSDVAGFSLGEWAVFERVAFVDMKDGTRIHVLALSAPNPMTRPNNRTAQTRVAELNRAVEARERASHAPV